MFSRIRAVQLFVPISAVYLTTLSKRSLCEDDVTVTGKLTTEEAQKLVKTFDKDGDGKISKEEIEVIIAEYKNNKVRYICYFYSEISHLFKWQLTGRC